MKRQSITLVIVVMALFNVFTVTAQKLPTVQQGSLRAPVDMKIDGIATEWDNKFQAYSKATQLFYTMANNDDQLYLTIKAADPTTIIRILTHGITLSVDNGSKNPPVSITFPLIKRNDLGDVKSGVRKKGANVTIVDSARALRRADSVARAWNNQVILKANAIKVTGIKDMGDTISVYDNDIKAMMRFDNKKDCTYELALPLKYLAPEILNSGLLKYHITINGADPAKGVNVQLSADGRAIERSSPGNVSVVMVVPPEQIALEFPTDFKGEYTLAKKP